MEYFAVDLMGRDGKAALNLWASAEQRLLSLISAWDAYNLSCVVWTKSSSHDECISLKQSVTCRDEGKASRKWMCVNEDLYISALQLSVLLTAEYSGHCHKYIRNNDTESIFPHTTNLKINKNHLKKKKSLKPITLAFFGKGQLAWAGVPNVVASPTPIVSTSMSFCRRRFYLLVRRFCSHVGWWYFHSEKNGFNFILYSRWQKWGWLLEWFFHFVLMLCNHIWSWEEMQK